MHKLALGEYIMSRQKQHGFTMLELLLAVAVGSIVVMGSFASYIIIARYHDRMENQSFLQINGLPTINFIIRDIRMAGNTLLDNTNFDPILGDISTPIVIDTDTAGSNWDEITIYYDTKDPITDVVTRNRVLYSIADSTALPGATRQLMVRRDTTTTANPDDATDYTLGTAGVVTDYVDAFQIRVDDPANPQLINVVDITLVLRSPNPLKRSQGTYSRNTWHHFGNTNFTFTDNYLRQSFDTTVQLRNN